MKICAIICEFNPFHNGHKYLIERAKLLSGCDKILCLMSGSYTQRGELCIMDKFVRARHAIECGADVVLELPVSFTVAPAEIFAAGAIKLLNSIPEVTTLAFGCENAQADFIGAARLLNNENEQFKRELNAKLDEGESYIKSYAAAFEACGGEKNLLARPNNVLALEYVKALVSYNSNISILPIQRKGADFDDKSIKNNYSSASAIRKNLDNSTIKSNVPECVFSDLSPFYAENELFENLLSYSIIQTNATDLQRIFGCGEGLENRIIKLSHLPLNDLIKQSTGRRYTSSRIRRILLANLLNLYADDCKTYLNSPLYLKPLVIKAEFADEILSSLSASQYPLILKQRDLNELSRPAKECFASDAKAYKIWKFIFKIAENDFDYPKFI